MDWGRWFRHLFYTNGAMRRAFPAATLDAIEAEITESETLHDAEIRFAVEGALEPAGVWRGKKPRDRALEVFAGLGVWDTEHNNGVLIYVLLADHDVEIVADRGYNERVTREQWAAVCDEMRGMFRQDRFREGSLVGVRAVDKLVMPHFPPRKGPRKADELPNRPTML